MIISDHADAVTKLITRATTPLPFAPPDIDESDIQAVVDVLRSGWITTGSRVREFERVIAEASDVKYGVAVNSATAALHLALDAIGLQRGDEVILPTTTFTATAEVVRYFDARPVLVDIERDTLCIAPEAIRSAVTERTRAIIPVHFAGHAADMDTITDIAKRHNLSVIADAAHGFSGNYRGHPIGSLGDISALSFYATKTITTGEGGMLLTNDAAVEERARVMALHGMSRDSWKRYSGSGSWRYDVVAPGYKYNLTDIAAALGISQFQRVDSMRRRRKSIAARYTEALSSIPGVETPESRPEVDHSWHLYVLRIDHAETGIGRDAAVNRIQERGIGVSVHFIPLHMFTYYREAYGYKDSDFPVATAEFDRYFSLPIYSAMLDSDVDDVIAIVSQVLNGSKDQSV
jgi:dTDP-4-amino-4,6-dideoxygalactose transaminase